LLLYDDLEEGYPNETNVDIYERAETGPNGMATFAITPGMPGIMKVTVTKHDYLPYLGTCLVSWKGNLASREADSLPTALSLTCPTVMSKGKPGTIRLALPQENEGNVRLSLYDASGRLEVLIHEGALEAGYHDFKLDKGLSSGIYILMLEVEEGSISKKVVIR